LLIFACYSFTLVALACSIIHVLIMQDFSTWPRIFAPIPITLIAFLLITCIVLGFDGFIFSILLAIPKANLFDFGPLLPDG
jgi:hypothetical protein